VIHNLLKGLPMVVLALSVSGCLVKRTIAIDGQAEKQDYVIRHPFKKSTRSSP